jgi:hypothetical protein
MDAVLFSSFIPLESRLHRSFVHHQQPRPIKIYFSLSPSLSLSCTMLLLPPPQFSPLKAMPMTGSAPKTNDRLLKTKPDRVYSKNKTRQNYAKVQQLKPMGRVG